MQSSLVIDHPPTWLTQHILDQTAACEHLHAGAPGGAPALAFSYQPGAHPEARAGWKASARP